MKISLMGFVYRVVGVLKALWIFLSETVNFLRKLHLTKHFWDAPENSTMMYIAPSSGHISLNFNRPFQLILRWFEVAFWCLGWSENAALFERLMEIHSNPPILYYGFNTMILAQKFQDHKCYTTLSIKRNLSLLQGDAH